MNATDSGEQGPLRERVAAAIPSALVLGGSDPNRMLIADAVLNALPEPRRRNQALSDENERQRAAVEEAYDLWDSSLVVLSTSHGLPEHNLIWCREQQEFVRQMLKYAREDVGASGSYVGTPTKEKEA